MKIENKRCKCGGKIGLFSHYISYWKPDLEPFKNGEYENINEIEDAETHINVCANICVQCYNIVDLWIEEGAEKFKIVIKKQGVSV